MPTLVLVGDQDTLAPPEAAEATATAIADAELVTVPGSGHLVTLEAPEAVTTAIQYWLQRIAQQRISGHRSIRPTDSTTPRTTP